MRNKIVAGNWKMNLDLKESKTLTKDVLKLLKERDLEYKKVILSPNFISLASCSKLAKETSVEIAAQNMHEAESGAFTGEISASMIKSAGADYVILGHSERRQKFHEDNALLKKKLLAALDNGLQIIYCIGETLEERESGNYFDVIESQLSEVLFDLSPAKWLNVVIAYEPVWAIGTGLTASPEQAQEMHAHIRNLLKSNFEEDLSQSVSILYGGSCKPSNAEALFSMPDVDGGLIGGASLKATDFVEIIDALG